MTCVYGRSTIGPACRPCCIWCNAHVDCQHNYTLVHSFPQPRYIVVMCSLQQGIIRPLPLDTITIINHKYSLSGVLSPVMKQHQYNQYNTSHILIHTTYSQMIKGINRKIINGSMCRVKTEGQLPQTNCSNIIPTVFLLVRLPIFLHMSAQRSLV